MIVSIHRGLVIVSLLFAADSMLKGLHSQRFNKDISNPGSQVDLTDEPSMGPISLDTTDHGRAISGQVYIGPALAACEGENVWG